MFRLFFITALLIILPTALSSGQGENEPLEYLVKAKYLLNIPLYVEMPSQARNDAPYTICLIGDTPLESILISSSGKKAKNRLIIIKAIEEFDNGNSCQMLFVASSERYRLQTLLSAAQHKRILTVSDMKEFTRQGGMIGLITVENRVTFDLNLAAASKSSIFFSSHLLKLARDVIN